jgi:hypothetical protein
MSDSVKKYYEMVEDGEIKVNPDKVNPRLRCEQKILDIGHALKEYEGNVIDKWQVINKIEEIMSRLDE